MGPVADQLLTDVKQLQAVVKTVKLEPATIANGAVELLNEVSSSKVSGEEERYSHVDLVDLVANVEGSRARSKRLRRCSRPAARSLPRRSPRSSMRSQRRHGAVQAG